MATRFSLGTNRPAAWAGVVLLHAALAYLLLGLAPELKERVEQARDPVLISTSPPDPPSVRLPQPPRTEDAQGGGSAPLDMPQSLPRSIDSAPEAVTLPDSPMPAPAVPVYPQLSDTPAAPLPGIEAGGAGLGTGTGAGRGAGAGDGGASTAVTKARKIEGSITASDYPILAARTGAQGSTRVRLDVGSDGRVTGCTVTTSSGDARLDRTTCKLMQERYRYTPGRDAAGRPVADVVNDRMIWRYVPTVPTVEKRQ